MPVLPRSRHGQDRIHTERDGTDWRHRDQLDTLTRPGDPRREVAESRPRLLQRQDDLGSQHDRCRNRAKDDLTLDRAFDGLDEACAGLGVVLFCRVVGVQRGLSDLDRARVLGLVAGCNHGDPAACHDECGHDAGEDDEPSPARLSMRLGA